MFLKIIFADCYILSVTPVKISRSRHKPKIKYTSCGKIIKKAPLAFLDLLDILELLEPLEFLASLELLVLALSF